MSQTPSPSSAAAVATAIRERRTIHEFRPQIPSRDLVLEAIEHARWAPNHHRTEPWHFYFLAPEAAQRISELNAELERAKQGEQAAASKLQRWMTMPGWLVITCERNADEIREREDFAACCCAVQNFMLYLWTKGVGVKWATGAVTRDPNFYSTLGLDASVCRVVGLFWYGYPAVVPEQTRKPLAAIVSELS
jgi:nitroreductase